MAKLFLFFVID